MKKTLPMLTDEQIDGDEAAVTAFEVLAEHLEDLNGDALTEHVRRLPPHWRVLHTLSVLQAEVFNGGHHQFFSNTGGVLNRETLEDLRLIKALPFALLFEEALDEFSPGDPAGKGKRMGFLDSAYSKVTKTLADHVADYVRTNRSLYQGRTIDGGP